MTLEVTGASVAGADALSESAEEVAAAAVTFLARSGRLYFTKVTVQ